MLNKKQIEFISNNIKKIQESNVKPYFGKKKVIITDPPITMQPAYPEDPTSKYNNPPEVESSSGKIIDNKNPTSFIYENFAIIPGSSSDLNTMNIDTGDPNQTIYIVRDKNTGKLVGGLAISTDANSKKIKFVETSPDGSMQKVISYMYSTNKIPSDSEVETDDGSINVGEIRPCPYRGIFHQLRQEMMGLRGFSNPELGSIDTDIDPTDITDKIRNLLSNADNV